MSGGDILGGLCIRRDKIVAMVGEETSDSDLPIVRLTDCFEFPPPSEPRRPNRLAKIFSASAGFFEHHNPKALCISAHGPFARGDDKMFGENLNLENPAGLQDQNLFYHAARHFGFLKNMPFRSVLDINAVALAEFVALHESGQFPFEPKSINSHGKTVAAVFFGMGVGGGISIGGKVWNGRMHPEMGHIPVGRASGDTRSSLCQYHSPDCLHGLACADSFDLDENGKVNAQQAELLAEYIARLAHVITFTIVPSTIALGGSLVWNNHHLIGLIREKFLSPFDGSSRKKEAYYTYPEKDHPNFLRIANRQSQALGTLYAASDKAHDMRITPHDK